MSRSRPNEEPSDCLVTPVSLALSLSPPRAPPHESAHRIVLLGQNPYSAFDLQPHSQNDGEDPASSPYHQQGLAKRTMELLHRSHSHNIHLRMPHPHLPYGPEVGDQVTRFMGALLPIPWVNAGRDSGTFRSIVDGLITLTVPSLAISNPSAARDFVRLTRGHCQRFSYGSHPLQVVDMLMPTAPMTSRYSKAPVTKPRGLVVFVHGGAWGSGRPWMYRLTAMPFLEIGMAVAIVGYRTYPDADAMGQVDDVEQACTFLLSKHPSLCHPEETTLGTCLMGHSSGAHIALLLLVRRVERRLVERCDQSKEQSHEGLLRFISFVGMSGPYDISHHFDYEAARGVEELSPMKPACGYSREKFRYHSPASRLQHVLSQHMGSEGDIPLLLPRILLLHGIEDTTVPFTATSEAVRILRACGVVDCDEVYVAKTGHQDTIMHMMLGGRSQAAVVDWLQSENRLARGQSMAIYSRL